MEGAARVRRQVSAAATLLRGGGGQVLLWGNFGRHSAVLHDCAGAMEYVRCQPAMLTWLLTWRLVPQPFAGCPCLTWSSTTPALHRPTRICSPLPSLSATTRLASRWVMVISAGLLRADGG